MANLRHLINKLQGLPAGAPGPVLDSAPPEWKHLATQASRLGVAGGCVDGEYGRITGPIGDSVILPTYARTGSWAPGINGLLAAYFQDEPCGAYVDVGANIGLTSIPLARRPGIQIHAVEPDPSNFAWLVHNVAANGCGEYVHAHQFAAHSVAGLVDLALAPENFGDHHIVTQTAALDPARPVVQVRAERLDDFIDVDTLPRPIAVKIDTQGAEPHVCVGAERLLAAAGLVILEYWPHGMRRIGADPAQVLESISRFSEGSVEAGEWTSPSRPKPIREVLAQLNELAATDHILNFRDVVLWRRQGETA